MKLVVGLGNPGRRYINHRHNVGFACIDRMAAEWGIRLIERRAKAVIGVGEVEGLPVALAKPRTFMNESGVGVTYLLARFRATPADLIIIYDEMDLPAGKVRLRPGGGAAGHNGMRSIISAVSTQDFARVRVGIGKPPMGLAGMDHVLRPFTLEERSLVQRAVETVPDVVACMLLDGIEGAMAKFN